MPASVIAAFAADTIATAVADAVIFDLVAATTLDWVASYAVIQAGASFVAGSVLRSALSGGAEDTPTTPSFTAQAEQRTHVIRSAVANRQIIYGRARVSGPLVFAASSSDNNTLHLVIALAGHEIDAVEEIYLNDELSTASKFSGYVTTAVHLGAADQVADSSLVAASIGWTSAHRLRGVAYLYVKLTYSRDVFPRGIPNISAVVRGKKLYDPRNGSTVWSQNLALAVRDYLAGSYGLASTDDEIDDTALIAAANICDESVTLVAGGTEARYTCNGVLDTGATPRSNMEALLSGGGAALTWPAGRWTLHAGAYESPVLSLGEDDLAGPLQVRARVPRQDLYNAVKGTFIDPLQGYLPTDFPAVTNSTYATQDGAQIFRDVALPVTASGATAQRLCKMMVEKSRQGITVQAPFKLSAFKVATWDNIGLTVDAMGWSDKVFKVTGWKFSEAGSVALTLQEEAVACYTWSAEETSADSAPDTNLPAWDVVSAPSAPDVTESLFETSGSSGVKSRATMAWGASEDAFIVDYCPEYRVASGSWIALPATSALTVDINDIAPGTYEFRLRARNALGVTSVYGGTRTRQIFGLTASPSNISGFTVTKSAGFALARWALTTDLDVRIGGRIIIRHSPATSGATWESGIIVEEFAGDSVSGLVPLITGTYMAKAVDSSGNFSASAASFVATEGMVTGWTTVATSTQHPAFSGSKTNLVVSGGALRLDVLGENAEGSYLFSAAIDMGTSATRRAEADIDALSFDADDMISSRGLVSTWNSVAALTINDCNVALYAATTDDDPAGSPTWSAWQPFMVADFTCRAMKFKLEFIAETETHNIEVTTLVVHLKEPV